MDNDQEQQLAFAEPLLRDFHEGWQAAARLYATYNKRQAAEHDETTAANCVRRHMFFEVKRRFDETPASGLRGKGRSRPQGVYPQGYPGLAV